MTARTPQRQQLLDLLSPLVEAQGYEIDDISVTAAGRRSLIRITVDSDSGIDLDAVADVSRAISEALDTADANAFAGPYVLEVSSPGVDRPLTEARHWRRAIGRLVTVTVGGQSITGRVVSVADSAGADITLDIDGAPKSWPLAELGKGRIQVEFKHADAALDKAFDDDLDADVDDDLEDDLDDDLDDDTDDSEEEA